MDSLDLRYSKSVLLKIYEKEGSVIQSDLKRIASNWRTLTDVINSLKDDGYLVVTERISGRRITQISLTEKGRSVAEQLKRAEEAAKGVVIHEDESRIEVSDIPEMWREKWKNLHALIHVNVFDDHVTIMETNHEGSGKERIFNIYVRENGQGHLRLWCELDESFDCYHVGYALTLAPVQDMFARVRGGK